MRELSPLQKERQNYNPKLASVPTTNPCRSCSNIIAIIGEMSSMPPIGGIIPLNILRNGSVIELNHLYGCCCQSIDGIQVKNILKIIRI